MKKNSLLLLILLLSFSFSSCKKTKIEEPKGKYDNGLFVINEGNLNRGNASITYFSENLNKKVDAVFKTVNALDLGDIAQSIGFMGDNAYIVVNNSHKIEVVNRWSMKKIVTMSSDLNNPRYFQAGKGNMAYVSCWGDASENDDDYLALINTKNNSIISTIHVPLGPEKLIADNQYLFVAHKGAFSTNNKVSVIDLVTQNIVATINVGDRPNSMVIKDHYLWVLCGGEPDWTGNETAGTLIKINIDNNFSIAQTLVFNTTQHPDFLSVDQNNLYYYLDGKIYKMNVNDTSLPTSEAINQNNIYNMQAYDGRLFVTDAKDYQSEGNLIVFDLSNNQKIATKTTGLIPGNIGFNF